MDCCCLLHRYVCLYVHLVTEAVEEEESVWWSWEGGGVCVVVMGRWRSLVVVMVGGRVCVVVMVGGGVWWWSWEGGGVWWWSWEGGGVCGGDGKVEESVWW